MATNTEVITGLSGQVQDAGGHGTAHSDAMGNELARASELGTSALEAQARAMIQARFFCARQPGMMRSWDHVEQRLLKECRRPGFAQSAWWVLPVGNDAKKYPAGLSIRFAESALRVAGNIDVEQMVVSDDKWKRTVRVRVMDLETNFGYTSEIVIDKTVERQDPKGREVLSYRQNSYGKMVYVVEATEQELAMKQGSAVSKAIRTSGLRLVPGDILDECKKMILATKQAGANAEDPESARKGILDNFASIDVMPADIAKLVEHDTDHFTPADRELLRGVYTAIKNGIATWKEVLEARFGPPEGAEHSPGAKKVLESIEKRKVPPTAAASTSDPKPTEAPKADPPKSTPAPAPAPAPTADSSDTLRDYNSFPDPMEDGTRISVKGVVYVSAGGSWRPANGKPEPKGKKDRGSLDFGS